MGQALSNDKLETYVRMATPILLEVARQRSKITYKELMEKMGGKPGRGYIGPVIGRISEVEFARNRIKLSALVVRNDTHMVGGGFFGLPDTPNTVRRMTPEEWKNPSLSGADRQYWQSELEKVYRQVASIK